MCSSVLRGYPTGITLFVRIIKPVKHNGTALFVWNMYPPVRSCQVAYIFFLPPCSHDLPSNNIYATLLLISLGQRDFTFPVRFYLSEISHTSCPGSQRNTSHLTLYDPLNLMVSYSLRNCVGISSTDADKRISLILITILDHYD